MWTSTFPWRLLCYATILQVNRIRWYLSPSLAATGCSLAVLLELHTKPALMNINRNLLRVKPHSQLIWTATNSGLACGTNLKNWNFLARILNLFQSKSIGLSSFDQGKLFHNQRRRVRSDGEERAAPSTAVSIGTDFWRIVRIAGWRRGASVRLS